IADRDRRLVWHVQIKRLSTVVLDAGQVLSQALDRLIVVDSTTQDLECEVDTLTKVIDDGQVDTVSSDLEAEHDVRIRRDVRAQAILSRVDRVVSCWLRRHDIQAADSRGELSRIAEAEEDLR